MKILYNIIIWLYTITIRIVSLFNEKARLWVKGRKDWKSKLQEAVAVGDRYYWFHCASLGEFEQGRPIIEAIKKENKEIKIFLTFFSPSGYEVRKDYSYADHIMYLPSDSKSNVRYFLNMLNPEKAVFIKYEFWFNYLSELERRDIPHFLVSGIFRESQYFFKWYGKYFLRRLKGFTHLFVQDESSEELLKRHDVESASISGDTRFDRVYDISRSSKELKIIEDFASGGDLIIAGSSWPAEEDILARFIKVSPDNYKWVIAPHEIGEEHIKTIENKLSVSSIRYSMAKGKDLDQYRVLIIDNIGLLSSAYRYGKLAIIGGGFGKGIHNILEPASWGLPVLFGPNFRKFKEAGDLINYGGAVSFGNYEEFARVIGLLLSNPDELGKASEAATEFVKSNLGASKIVLDMVV